MRAVHFAFIKGNDGAWCSYHDPHGTITKDASKVTCWHCLGWIKFGPGKDVDWEAA